MAKGGGTYTSTGVKAPWVMEQPRAPASAKREYRSMPSGFFSVIAIAAISEIFLLEERKRKKRERRGEKRGREKRGRKERKEREEKEGKGKGGRRRNFWELQRGNRLLEGLN